MTFYVSNFYLLTATMHASYAGKENRNKRHLVFGLVGMRTLKSPFNEHFAKDKKCNVAKSRAVVS